MTALNAWISHHVVGALGTLAVAYPALTMASWITGEPTYEHAEGILLIGAILVAVSAQVHSYHPPGSPRHRACCQLDFPASMNELTRELHRKRWMMRMQHLNQLIRISAALALLVGVALTGSAVAVTLTLAVGWCDQLAEREHNRYINWCPYGCSGGGGGGGENQPAPEPTPELSSER